MIPGNYAPPPLLSSYHCQSCANSTCTPGTFSKPSSPFDMHEGLGLVSVRTVHMPARGVHQNRNLLLSDEQPRIMGDVAPEVDPRPRLRRTRKDVDMSS